MTRRDIARLAAGSAALYQTRAAQTDAPQYTGPLDGALDKVNGAGFDPIIFSHKLYESAPLRLSFQAQNRQAAEQWQKTLRAKVAELIGAFPQKRTPLLSQTLEVREYPGYRREKFVFQSRPDAWVLGYLLIPKAERASYSPVVCIPGHGRGVDDIVGIDERGRDRTTKVGYAYDYAIQVAEHGMAAVAIEPLGFGCRRDPAAKKGGLGQSACQPSSGSALLLGQTMIGWRVWDIMRTIDWIETRTELNSARVGCMGCSGGGMATLFGAALEPRIRAALVSSYLNTFRDSVMSVSHCIDNYVPAILNWAEMYDVAGLVAPRPLFAESGEQDNIFPVAASRASFERVKKIYTVFGAAGLTDHEVFPAPHSFWGKRGLPFLARHLA